MGSDRNQLVGAVIAALATLIGGFSIGFSAPTILPLQERDILHGNEVSWYGSVVTLGGAAGAPLAGALINRYGRRTTIIASGLPAMFGYLLIASSTLFYCLIVGRILTGISLGVACTSVPTYIAEISTTNMRGLVGSGPGIGIAVGILFAFLLGIPLDLDWLAVCGVSLSAIMILLMLFMPETPAWLISRGRDREAASVLQWLRMDEAAAHEEHENLRALIHSQPQLDFTWRIFTAPHVYRPLSLTLVLMSVQQLSGLNVIVFYTESIFKEANWSGNPHLPSIIIASCQAVMTVLSCSFVDRLGRRTLLVISGTGLTLSTLTMGLYFYLTNVRAVSGISSVSVISLAGFVVFFSIGWGCIPYIILGEFFPADVGGPASAVSITFNWLCSFLVTNQFANLEDAISSAGAFWVLSGISLFGVLFVVFFLPETRGKTLYEIQQRFRQDREDYEQLN